MPRPTKKKALAPLSEQAKMILRNQRRRLQNEQQELAERQRAETRNLLDHQYVAPASGWALAPRYSQIGAGELSFQKVIVPRVTAVLASERIKATVNVKMNAATTSAWTDFSNINVTLIKGIEVDPANAAAVLRGLLYHEGGHIKYSVPLNVLVTRYNAAIRGDDTRTRLTTEDVRRMFRAWNILEDQRMETQVIEDSPAKARYFSPMFLDVVVAQGKRRLALAEKLAEAQAKGDTNSAERIAEQMNDVTDVKTAYPWVIWRRYVNRDLRRSMRASYVKAHGEAKTREVERAVVRYIRATDAISMVDAIQAFYKCLGGRMPNATSNHGEDEYSHPQMPEDRKDEVDAPAPVITPEDLEEMFKGLFDGDDEGDNEGDDDEDGDVFGGEDEGDKGVIIPEVPEDTSWAPQSDKDFTTVDDDEDEADEVEDEADVPTPSKSSDGEGGGGSADHEPSKSVPEADEDDDNEDDEDEADEVTPEVPEVERDFTGMDDGEFVEGLENLLKEAVEERDGDPIVLQDGREFTMAFDGDLGSKLIPYHSTAETNVITVGGAHSLAQELEEAFHAVTTEAMPNWHEQQTRGIVNVGRYVTKARGDREFFRSFDTGEQTQPGHNLAVSVLLDYSGSMGSDEAELAAVGYGMKAACDALDIPCTVVLWDDGAKLLWDGNVTAEHVPVINATGGTNPTVALGDIRNHRFDRDFHIVLVMTDGAFSTAPGYLNQFRTPGTTFLGAIYNHGGAVSSKELEALSIKGFDVVHGVQALRGLVSIMEDTLTTFVSAA